MSVLQIVPVQDDETWDAVRAIRQRVFVEEQACPPEDEWDAYDWPENRGRTCRHLLAVVDRQPVGTARWREVWAGGERWAKLERFAVVPEARGLGYGRQLVEAAMADARAAGHSRLMLSAQTYLREFYARWGFQAHGEVFQEAGIPHVKMTLEG